MWRLVVILGIDYSGHAPSPAAVKAARFALVLRYLSPPPNPKNLTFPEAQGMIAAGVDVVTIWESTANAALGGHPAGLQHGVRARLMADACGAPQTSCIYFAVDFDAQSGQFPTIAAYQDGFTEGANPHPVGPYGSVSVVADMMGRGAPYGWQTCAWSRGKRLPYAHLYQRVQQVMVGGTVCDVNEATGPYGGWLTTQPVQPTHLPLPPSLTDPEEPTVLVPMQLPVTANGEGFWDADGAPVDIVSGTASIGYPRPLIPWAKFRAVTVNGNDGTPSPPDHGTARANQHGNVLRVSFSGFPPGASPLIWVLVAL